MSPASTGLVNPTNQELANRFSPFTWRLPSVDNRPADDLQIQANLQEAWANTARPVNSSESTRQSPAHEIENNAIQAEGTESTNLPSESNQFERLVIPSLKVNARIVFVPFADMTWDLSDLGQDIAWLGGISEGDSSENLVLAGHTTVFNGSNGPFRYLAKLEPGDIVQVYTKEEVYTFQVREQIVVQPDDVSVMDDTFAPQLTLVTCTTWDETAKAYLRRRVVFADLVEAIIP